MLAGKPGVGKTFLLQELMKENWVSSTLAGLQADLEDAIREMKPRRIVLDDAHLRDDKEIVWQCFESCAVRWMPISTSWQWRGQDNRRTYP